MASQSLGNDSDGSLVDNDVGGDVSSDNRGHVVLYVVNFGLDVVLYVVNFGLDIVLYVVNFGLNVVLYSINFGLHVVCPVVPDA